ncbi:DNA-binding protein [Lawsonella clevelandensis]|uniref:DNA-binding protein n=2 Tax=Lawsonella clevelandensis TaxID=1528099 RepID=A0A5E4A044_9ACTN|nr:DNA-binding protein [Lawsonella clevelandensis]
MLTCQPGSPVVGARPPLIFAVYATELAWRSYPSFTKTSTLKGMSSLPTAEDVLGPADGILPLSDVAQLLNVPVTRIHQLLRQQQLIAVERDGVLGVPALFFDEQGTAKHITGLIAVLADGGYSTTEILRFLYTADDSLPGRPIDALHGHLAREVMRRAQAMAL